MKKRFLHLNSRDVFLRIDISKIVYFEADGNYTNIVLLNQLKGVVCMNLAHVQQVLAETLKEDASIFARIGKRHIINHNYVYQISVLNQKLVLSDGENFIFRLDVSKDALKKLNELYASGRQSSNGEME